MKNKQKIFLPVLVIVILIGFYLFKPQKQVSSPQNTNTPIATIIPTQNLLLDQFEYPGQEGVDALTLLKQKTSVEQNSSGLVVSISGKKADDSLREFWSFYINGQSAQVGPASYITKDNDIINWKIEKY